MTLADASFASFRSATFSRRHLLRIRSAGVHAARRKMKIISNPGASMTTSISARFFAAAALAVAALGNVSAVHARSDVYFSIGIQGPPVYVQPAPVYVQPRPVYVQPYPVYVQPAPIYLQPAPIYLQPAPVYLQSQPIYVQPRPYGYSYQDDRGWRRAEWQRRHWKHQQREWGKHHDHDD